MQSEQIIPLTIKISGFPTNGESPGYEGELAAELPFAAALFVQAGTTLWWAKAEVSPDLVVPLRVQLRSLSFQGTSSQLHYSLGRGGIDSAIVSIPPAAALDLRPTIATFPGGQQQTLFRIATDPPLVLGAFFLAHRNVHPGRTGVWRPHEAILHALPPGLRPILMGPRFGIAHSNAGA